MFIESPLTKSGSTCHTAEASYSKEIWRSKSGIRNKIKQNVFAMFELLSLSSFARHHICQSIYIPPEIWDQKLRKSLVSKQQKCFKIALLQTNINQFYNSPAKYQLCPWLFKAQMYFCCQMCPPWTSWLINVSPMNKLTYKCVPLEQVDL